MLRTSKGLLRSSGDKRPNHSHEAQAGFAVVDANSKILLQDIVVQGTDLVSRSITFDKSQLIIILVKGIENGDSVGKGTYTVQFSGPIEVGR